MDAERRRIGFDEVRWELLDGRAYAMGSYDLDQADLQSLREPG